jgi:hypothetical protein
LVQPHRIIYATLAETLPRAMPYVKAASASLGYVIEESQRAAAKHRHFSLLRNAHTTCGVDSSKLT